MKNKLRVIFWIAVLTVGLSTCKEKTGEQLGFALDYDQIANQIVKQMSLQPGEKVILVAQPGRFDPLVDLLRKGIEDSKAEYLGTFSVDSIAPPDWQTEFTKFPSWNPVEEIADFFKDVDVGIMLPGAATYHPYYAGMQEVLRRGQGRTIHFHWSGAYDSTGNPIEITKAIDSVYQSALLNTDYTKLAAIQKQFEAVARNQLIRVTTPQGTDIQFRIGDRPVTRQDGNASGQRLSDARNLIDREIELPAGAIRVAPIEESVEGWIVFPQSNWNGIDINNTILTFKSGRITEVEAAFEDQVLAELEMDDSSRSFREFALGFNRLLSVPGDTAWIPYYGYGAGVVRLSLGDNTELGGKVKGNYVRWNFFLDATVTVGDEVWVKDGKLMKIDCSS